MLRFLLLILVSSTILLSCSSSETTNDISNETVDITANTLSSSETTEDTSSETVETTLTLDSSPEITEDASNKIAEISANTDSAYPHLILENPTNESLIPSASSSSSASGAPPKVIYFRELSEYTEFLNALELPDEELLEFLYETNYNMNGLRTVEDAQILAEKLRNLTIPVIENLTWIQTFYYPDNDHFVLTQGNEADKWYNMRVYPTPEQKENFLQNVLSAMDAADPTRTHTIEEDTLYHYYAQSSTSSAHWYQGFLDGQLVNFWATNTDKAIADEVVAGLTFTTFADLLTDDTLE